ncbi:hypothetical protein PsorP6_013491 [Peronosclerospora sorghi]|uniref:Uncharacterized protein n=1 Tax=Peronosclerospora sorghi TaxID=230839 RepID=A0ACC0VK54_9STRA|nr:hypothetical protein PsorP6_013491 [Peronosclerospora sorghi]
MTSLFKLTTILGTSNERAHVETNELAIQGLGHVAHDNATREPFHNRSLADARLANEHGIVLCASRKDADHTSNLFVATNDGVNLPCLGQFNQVLPVLVQRVIIVFRRRIRDGPTASHLLHGLFHLILIHLITLEQRRDLRVGKERDDQVIRGQVRILHVFAHLVRVLEHLHERRVRANGIRRRGLRRQLFQLHPHIVEETRGIAVHEIRHALGRAIFILKERVGHVQRRQLRVVELLGLVLRISQVLVRFVSKFGWIHVS